MANKIYFYLLLIHSLTLLTGKAFSVEQPSFFAWQKSKLVVKIPVRWELTRSLFNGKGFVTESENYRENWQLILKKGAHFYLKTPRKTVPVSGASFTGGFNNMPSVLVIPKQDFARALGLHINLAPQSEEGEEGATLLPDLVSISMKSLAKREQVFHLLVSAEESYQIRVAIGR